MKKVMILTFSKVYNRGANMQCYALMKTLQRMDCDVKFIDAQLPREKLNFKGKLFYWFSHFIVAPFRRNVGFKYTKEYKTYEDLCKNPPKADVYIVGSDQVWNPDITNVFDPRVYFLGYINEGKKISYAASFGKDKWTNTIHDEQIIEDLSKFAAISVREDSGIEICRKTFLRENGVCVLDPTLLLQGDDIRALIKKNKKKIVDKYMYVYLLHEDKTICDILDEVSHVCGLSSKGNTAKGGFSKLLNIESISSWLENIDNAELIVTNSFHCMAMSILLHKQFLVIPSFPGREVRMTSLLDKLGIGDRYISSNVKENFDNVRNINYVEVDKKLAEYRNKSIEFLQKSL